MNIKKIVSAVTAFALSATMFAGFSIQANAAPVAVSKDYEDDVNDWKSSNTGRYTASIVTDSETSNKYMAVVAVGNGNNGTTCQSASYNVSAGNVRIEFDAQITNGNNKASSLYLYDINGGTLLSLAATVAGGTTYKINGNADTTVTLAKTEWYHYSITWVDSKTYLKVTDTSAKDVFAYSEITNISTVGGVSKMVFNTARYSAGFNLDNLIISKLTAPAFNLSATEATVASGKTATVNVTDIVGTVSVESDKPKVATAEYADGVVTIKYVADGVANVTVTATNDGLTTEKTIAVISGTVAKTNVTINYVSNDANKTTLLKSDTVSDVNVGSSLDLSSYIAKVTSYTDTKTGVTYTATYAGESTTVTVTEGMSYDLKYDLEEKLYTKTVTAVPHAVVVVKGTSTLGNTVNETKYTAYSTKAATFSLPMGTYSVTVTKNGYTNGTGNITVSESSENLSITDMVLKDANALYYEDFATAGNVNDYSIFGGYRIVSAGVMQTMWSGLTAHIETIPFDDVSTTGTKIEIDNLYTKLGVTQAKSYSIKFNDASGNALITLTATGYKDGTTPSTLVISNGTDKKELLATELGEVVVDGKTVEKMVDKTATSDFIINFVDGKAVGSYNGVAFELSVTDVNVASFTIDSANNNDTVFQMDAIRAYKLPVITAKTSSTVITSVPTSGTVSAQPVNTDGTLGTAENVDLTGVTTLYIKVENATGVIPEVVLNDAEKTVVKPTRTTDVASTVGTDTYFVYQFVGVDLTDATISYGDITGIAID